MAKREKKSTMKKDDRSWFVATIVLLLFIAGVLYLDYSRKKEVQNTMAPEFTTSIPPGTLHPMMADSEIQNALDSGQPMVLYFYSSTCSSCVQAKENVLLLEEKLKAYDVKLIKVESTQNQATFEKLNGNISNIIAWRGREVLREPFNSNTDADEMVRLILKALGIS